MRVLPHDESFKGNFFLSLVEYADTIPWCNNLWSQAESLAKFHPIEVVVNHASQIDTSFYSITCNEGASVIRKLQSYLDAEISVESVQIHSKTLSSCCWITQWCSQLVFVALNYVLPPEKIV